jgi:TRAP-type C4-dicarboxylate transport system permease small subunit
MNNKNKTSHFYNLFSAFFAFFLWGSWAYFVNSGNEHSGIFSGLAQGTASFVITLFLVHAVTRLYHQCLRVWQSYYR